MKYVNLCRGGLFFKTTFLLAALTSASDSEGANTNLSGGSSARPSLSNQFPPPITPDDRIDRSVRADDRHGVANTFDIALHDPSLTFSTVPGKIQVNCPAAIVWNQQYALNSTEKLDPDAVEERWIVSYLQLHPDQTLWELFTHTLYQDVHKWATGSNPVESGADIVVKFVADVLQNFVLMMWAAFKWIVKFPFQPRKEWKQVEGFATELWDENAINAVKTIVGGLMLHLLLHPAEFTAESILLVGAGFQVIHGLMHGMEAIAGSLPPSVGKAIMAVLVFIHILDDPLLILTPILTNTAQSIQALRGADASRNVEDDGGFTSSDGSKAITLPDDCIIPATPTCALTSPAPGAPPLKYGNLCHAKDSSSVREIIFGTKKSSMEMSREERLEAYRHVRQFWCCYGQGSEVQLPDGVLDDVPGREIWEGKTYWKSIDDCAELPGSQDALPAPSRLTLGL